MIIDWINFGEVSAERDDLLSEYFFENGVLEAVVKNRHQMLVLGRKGAGKTAVFQHFSGSPEKYIADKNRAITSSLENYSWDVHNLLASEGKAASLAYIQSWKYVIYLLSIKKLVEAGVKSKRMDNANKIINRIYTSPAPGISDIIGRKLLQLSKLKLPGASVDLTDGSFDGISADGGEVTFSEVRGDNLLISGLNSSIERLTTIFEEALSEALAEKDPIFVIFDRIDEAWDASSFESSQRIISGLIGAAEGINKKFKGKLRPIIFLREDIFNTLDLNDKNKLSSDCGQLLAWTKDSLSRLILERVNYFARKSGNSEFSSIEDIFDKTQMRQQRTPFDYIMLRTMVRPRDFIKFFQLIKKNMQDRNSNPYDKENINAGKLECQSIYNSEPAYSEWLVEELRDEWRVQYPRINDLFAAIQNHGSTVLTANDLAKSLSALGLEPSTSDLNGFLRFLYDNSIIGFKIGNSQQWKFKCFFNSQGFVEADLYKVHDGLHRGLNLTESRKSA